MNEAIAVYVHIPFCPSKCGYCDFNSYAMSGEIVPRTVAATIAEIRSSPVAGIPAKTIFFGGGTPTFLDAADQIAILDAVREVHPPIAGAEITTEANPGTVDAERFAALAGAGFNRVSLGAQSFQSGDLVQLGRVHEASDIARAVLAARQAGIENLNLDLMFALPGQSMAGWRKNLETALALRPEHLSLYCLTIEPNTRFYRYTRRGWLDLPDDDAQTEMADLAAESCAAHGLEQYEISNFARPGRECQHNLAYWHHEDYAAYGPGAVRCLTTDGIRRRETNLKHPERYCTAVEGKLPLACEAEDLTPANLAFERLMLGLRLSAGLPWSSEYDPLARDRLVERGWIEPDLSHLRLTKQGRHFCSEAVVELAGRL